MIQVRRHHKLLHSSLLDCRDILQRTLFWNKACWPIICRTALLMLLAAGPLLHRCGRERWQWQAQGLWPVQRAAEGCDGPF